MPSVLMTLAFVMFSTKTLHFITWQRSRRYFCPDETGWADSPFRPVLVDLGNDFKNVWRRLERSRHIVSALRRGPVTAAGRESDWMAAEDPTSLNSSLSTNTRTPRLLLFHYLPLHIVMLREFNVVPFIVENEKCHFPLLSLSLSMPTPPPPTLS